MLRIIKIRLYFFVFLGMTEVGGMITLQLPHHKNGSCGIIFKNGQIKVVDPKSGKVLGPNESGEIWIKSANMMNGYYRNPEATKSIIDEEGKLIIFFIMNINNKCY